MSNKKEQKPFEHLIEEVENLRVKLEEAYEALEEKLEEKDEKIEELQARIEELESEIEEAQEETVLDQCKREIVDRFMELPISELQLLEEKYFKGIVV